MGLQLKHRSGVVRRGVLLVPRCRRKNIRCDRGVVQVLLGIFLRKLVRQAVLPSIYWVFYLARTVARGGARG